MILASFVIYIYPFVCFCVFAFVCMYRVTETQRERKRLHTEPDLVNKTEPRPDTDPTRHYALFPGSYLSVVKRLRPEAHILIILSMGSSGTARPRQYFHDISQIFTLQNGFCNHFVKNRRKT